MGAASSTQTKHDPITGKTKTKHKMGGSYPGNRRKGNAPYTPPASQFSNGQATSHFVSYGGGNALVLKQGGLAQPQIGAAVAKQPEYIQVTLPDGVYAGQTIQVAAPDGRLNEIVVPQGFGPGSTFTVEFADPNEAPKSYESSSNSFPQQPSSAQPVPTQGSTNDDGFASGFNNSGFTPTATAYGAAGDYSQYPSATDAQPIYAEAAQPVSSNYSPSYSSTYTPYVSK